MNSVTTNPGRDVQLRPSNAFVTFFATLLFVAPIACTGQEMSADLANQSDIIVVGTVVQVGSTSMASLSAERNIIDLEISEILEKPAVVTLNVADVIAVRVKDLDDFEEGAEVTLYAQGWILGASVAVIEVGHTVAPAIAARGQDDPGTDRSGELAAIRAQQAEESLRQRVEAADRIVEGRVRAVTSMEAVATRGGTTTVSEHDANWQEAIVEVTETIKGDEADEIVVRFPNSTDVAWYGVPKLTEGQQGIFLLTADQVSGGAVAVPRGGTAVSAYTALEPSDVVEPADYDLVRRLAGGN